jgi:hypothetical protein
MSFRLSGTVRGVLVVNGVGASRIKAVDTKVTGFNVGAYCGETAWADSRSHPHSSDRRHPLKQAAKSGKSVVKSEPRDFRGLIL